MTGDINAGSDLNAGLYGGGGWRKSRRRTVVTVSSSTNESCSNKSPLQVRKRLGPQPVMHIDEVGAKNSADWKFSFGCVHDCGDAHH